MCVCARACACACVCACARLLAFKSTLLSDPTLTDIRLQLNLCATHTPYSDGVYRSLLK